jgi:hypothetical protein
MGPVRTRFRRPRRDRAGTRGPETTPTDSPGLASSACRLMEQKSPVAERLRRRSAYPQRGQSSPGVHCRSRLVRCAHRAAPLRGRRRGTRCRERRQAHHSRRTHALALILDPRTPICWHRVKTRWDALGCRGQCETVRLRLPRLDGTCETCCDGWTGLGGLITQRSEVQILPPLRRIALRRRPFLNERAYAVSRHLAVCEQCTFGSNVP